MKTVIKAAILVPFVAAAHFAFPSAAKESVTAESLPGLARALQLQQDEFIRSGGESMGTHSEILARMTKTLSRPAETLQLKSADVHAIATYLMNGGSAGVVRGLLRAGADLGPDSELIIALLAHVEGRVEAEALLSSLDTSKLPGSVNAQVALAQAKSTRSSSTIARTYLAKSKALTPGTLTEESAMRREIKLLLQEKKHDDALRLVARYAWKFGNNRHAKTLIAFLADEILPGLIISSEYRDQFSRFLAVIDSEERRNLLLAMAAKAILDGKLEVARLAGELVSRDGPDNSASKVRGRAYESIAKVLSGQEDPTAAGLDGIDRTHLSAADAGALDATRAVIDRIRAVERAEPEKAAEPTRAISAAGEALARADASLSEVMR